MPASSAAWLTYGGSFARTSLDSTDPAFDHKPSRLWTSPALDAPVYGEPLIYKQQVFVATENDTVYALSAADGALVWTDHLASPVPAGMLPCGDIAPTVGITSTMVIDPVTGTLFASAEELSGSSVRHVVYALDIATHRALWSRGVDQGGWTAGAQLQRTGLALSAGHVIVGFGGNFGDCGTYHGWVVGVPESGAGPLLAYKVPTAREGAIWAPAGVTVNPAGDVLVVTGNGSAGPGQPFDHGDSVIELSPTLAERGYFAPSNWAQDNADDGDLGSTAVMLLDNSRMFVVGKQQTAYLLDATTLGGVGGQLASKGVCGSLGGNAYLAPNAYVVCTDDGTIDQVRVGPGATMSARLDVDGPPREEPAHPRSPVECCGPSTSARRLLYGVEPVHGVHPLHAVPHHGHTTTLRRPQRRPGGCWWWRARATSRPCTEPSLARGPARPVTSVGPEDTGSGGWQVLTQAVSVSICVDVGQRTLVAQPALSKIRMSTADTIDLMGEDAVAGRRRCSVMEVVPTLSE